MNWRDEFPISPTDRFIVVPIADVPPNGWGEFYDDEESATRLAWGYNRDCLPSLFEGARPRYHGAGLRDEWAIIERETFPGLPRED